MCVGAILLCIRLDSVYIISAINRQGFSRLFRTNAFGNRCRDPSGPGRARPSSHRPRRPGRDADRSGSDARGTHSRWTRVAERPSFGDNAFPVANRCIFRGVKPHAAGSMTATAESRSSSSSRPAPGGRTCRATTASWRPATLLPAGTFCGVVLMQEPERSSNRGNRC